MNEDAQQWEEKWIFVGMFWPKATPPKKDAFCVQQKPAMRLMTCKLFDF